MALLLVPGLASCQDKAKMKFSVQVVDDAGSPIADCKVNAVVFSHWKAGEGFGRAYHKATPMVTDRNGDANFQIESKTSDLTYYAEPPEGYYRTYHEEYFFGQPAKNGVWQPENEKFKVILKRKKNPIAMYARGVGWQEKAEIPEVEKACGFDLVVSDWVAPHGKGKIADLLFNLVREQRARNDYDATLTVSFSNEGDGIVSYKAPAGKGSRLMMPYMAPEKGYKNKLKKSRQAEPGKTTVPGYSRDQHYFIRVRTVLDEQGNVVSALYGKIQEDIKFWNNRAMRFTYYVNPAPNDRNVEYDPKKNLIDTGRRGHKVQNP